MLDAAQEATLKACESSRSYPDWLLEEFGIRRRGLLETRDQAFKRQHALIQWKVAERNYQDYIERTFQ